MFVETYNPELIEARDRRMRQRKTRVSKLLDCQEPDTDSISGSGITPGAGNGNPCQYSCLDNSRDSGACRATVHGVVKSQDRAHIFGVLEERSLSTGLALSVQFVLGLGFEGQRV